MDTLEFDIEFLAQKISENPQSPLFARLADLYLEKMQTTEALKLCEEGVALFPEYYAGYIVLGKTHIAFKEFSKARAALKKAKELSPLNPLIQKIIDSIATAPDEQTRTTDEDYFTSQQTIKEDGAAAENGTGAAPLNESLFDAVTPDEMSYIQQTGIGAAEVTQNTDLGYSEPLQQDFASFDEYYSEHKPVIDKSEQSTLDDYLMSSPVSASTTANEPVENNFIDEPAVEQPVEPAQTANEAMENDQPSEIPSGESVETIEESGEPEMVFASPEQAQLFAEMNDGGSSTENLDDLAEKLQNAERIVPKEAADPVEQQEDQQESGSDYGSDMVTPTLAEIYASQGEYRAAIQAYEILMFSHPEKGAGFQKRIQELQQMQMEKDGLI